ncbi:gamma-glutamyltransferase [Planktothricoides sp. SR001]|uniref:gamma-glutamyltransferase n=1 Tax=Planktothricoides sp. SR001 TaxID=1705388 RepID=UPI0006C8D184|nr:gamma-glutamyltransferase [Planktothricoides sp. SR001]
MQNFAGLFYRYFLSVFSISYSLILLGWSQDISSVEGIRESPLQNRESPLQNPKSPLQNREFGYKKGMVVAAHPLASDAGLAMLQKGGNAVDAAVATAFVISVVEPFSAGIGGGGFLLLREANSGDIRALDFRERSPLAATRDMYLDENGQVIPRASLDGHLAVGVPGTVAGLYEVHQKYGQLPWATVVAQAISWANDGFPVGEYFVYSAEQRREVLLKNPAARAIFTKDGEIHAVGDRLVQPDLGKTLQQIAANWQSFYTGEIAQAIADDMAKNGGLITLADLKAYQPIWREPVCGLVLELRVCSMPPPSSGGVHLLQILNIITAKPANDSETIQSWAWQDPKALHLLAGAMQIAYADRSLYLGDPDFVTVPVQEIISPIYGQQRRQEIDLGRARSQTEVKPVDEATLKRLQAGESENTTHLTVVDQDRNVVSLTFTVNGNFGAGVVTPGTGILLNNEMDDFAIAPLVPNLFGLVGDDANAIAPKKTPLSSMTPTIVTKPQEGDRFFMAVGSPGGSTIITTVLQLILNVAVYDQDANGAVSAPRIHHQWLPDKLWIETGTDGGEFDSGTLAALENLGYSLDLRDTWGNANLIIQTKDGFLDGAADPRREGAARGF